MEALLYWQLILETEHDKLVMTPNETYYPEENRYEDDSNPMALKLTWTCEIADIEAIHNKTKLKYSVERRAHDTDIINIQNALRVFFQKDDNHRFLVILITLESERCLEFGKEGKEYHPTNIFVIYPQKIRV